MSSKPLFPKSAIEDKLRAWYKRKKESPLAKKKTNPRKTGGTVFDIQPEVSSQEAVQVFIEVEPLLGFKLKTKIVKLGGYGSCDEFVQHLLLGIEAQFNTVNSVTKKAVA